MTYTRAHHIRVSQLPGFGDGLYTVYTVHWNCTEPASGIDEKLIYVSLTIHYLSVQIQIMMMIIYP